MSTQCVAYRHGKTPCENESQQMAMGILPLCKSHLQTLQREMRIERQTARQRAGAAIINAKIIEARERRESAVVYFITAGRRVKIGQSRNPEVRLQSIRGGYTTKTPKGLDTSDAKLVATESGGQPREHELHQQFAHLRVTGEWFDNKNELKAYIQSLRHQAA